MAERYPAVTLWQPWATLVSAGVKPIEFRAAPPPRWVVGKRVAIHAGARPVKRKEVRDLIYQLQHDAGLQATYEPLGRALDLLDAIWGDPARAPTRSVLCLATLGEPLPPDEIKRRFANDSDRDGHFSWGWPLSEIQPLEPIAPATGQQGWWWWERAHG